MKCIPGGRPRAKGLNWIFSFNPQVTLGSGKHNVSKIRATHGGPAVSTSPHAPPPTSPPYPTPAFRREQANEMLCVTQQRCLFWHHVLSPDEILTLLFKETNFFRSFIASPAWWKVATLIFFFFFFQGKRGKLGVCSRHWNCGQNNSVITCIWYKLWWVLSEFLRDVTS